uniref:Uncharacterized protein n=1 Tax=Romanomermis culicivorax TaxID=13658 RepID=A0A915HXK2_ROMCU
MKNPKTVWLCRSALVTVRYYQFSTYHRSMEQKLYPIQGLLEHIFHLHLNYANTHTDQSKPDYDEEKIDPNKIEIFGYEIAQADS